jgi:aminoglycoside 6-adenylyltransferase
VRETHPLLEETAWYEWFGEVLVTEALENPEWHPTRLVYYVDGKIDFMIAPVRSLSEGADYDGPYLVPVDKDGRGDRLEPTVGVTPPSAEALRQCVEWFYAAALQYAKAVVRNDPWPVKTRDADLKSHLLQMLEWDHGVRTGWASRTPHNGSRIAEWVAPDIAADIAASWADFSMPASVEALRNSMRLFDLATGRVAVSLGYDEEITVKASAEVDRLVGLIRDT